MNELKKCINKLQENHTNSEIGQALYEYSQIVSSVAEDYNDDTMEELRSEHPELDFMDDEELEEILELARGIRSEEIKMNELKIFENKEFGQIRTVTINNEPWLCMADICKVLEIGNVSQAKTRLLKDGVIINEVIDSLGRKQKATFINESNLYKLIFQSRKEAAERFTDWVTSEVLPAIRKHGVYAVDEVLENPDMLISALQELKAERAKKKELEMTIAVQNQQIQEMQPKASYYDVVLNCKDLISTSAIAKDYGKSAIWMNRYLHDKGVQFKQGSVWLLYQKYAEKGYTNTKTHSYPADDGEIHTKVHTYWTQKGRIFLYDLLKADGILPLIEVA